MKMRADPACFGAVILAAGFSRRMGRPKALLPWGRTSVIGHIIALYHGQTDQLAVVCRSDDAPLQGALDAATLLPDDRIFNPDPLGDMYSSVRLAFQWKGWRREITHLVLSLIDQPQIRPATIATLIEAAGRSPDSIIQPTFNGRRQHPVILPRILARSMAQDPSIATLKDALHHHHADIIPLQVEDPGLSIDFDTPAEYAAVQERFLPNPP